MRFLALACDYDGTLARHGRVGASTVAALERVRATGRKLLLVTGRQLDDLCSVFAEIDLFDCVVAENGALLYDPRTRAQRSLGEPPPAAFIEALRRRYVPVSVGSVIVATWEPHERVVLETIRDLGLELQVIFNKGAVMVLPAGISKASGLAAGLDDLALSPHNVVGVGDAENDHAFLAACECSVAVANALPTIQERADVVTKGEAGAGVEELAAELIANDLAAWEPRLERHWPPLGTRRHPDGAEATILVPPYGTSLLICGGSGAGKSTLAAGVLERVLGRGYQCCVIDPEGDYGTVAGTLPIGTPQRAPTDEEVVRLLEDPRANAIVDFTGVRVADRPAAFARLMARLDELLARTGRPHWLLVDEAHHVAPSAIEPNATLVADRPGGLVLITVEPQSVAPALLATVTVACAVGDRAPSAIRELARALGVTPPTLPKEPPPAGHALVWDRQSAKTPFVMRIEPAVERIEGISPERSRELIRDAIEKRYTAPV
jgi:hydroxymethylpyrimidine pyrophosphatase-like HAD family hydrolase